MYLLVGCQFSPASRLATAREIAAAGRLEERDIPAGSFVLKSFSRVEAPGRPANVYIEGDGFAWIDRKTPSPDPSPLNPIGLKLAAADSSPNVLYLARPCQYIRNVRCDARYWTSARFTSKIIEAFGDAVSKEKQKNHLGDINLIGFSGGGAVAALLAARRSDILSLRTVAGNLDTSVFGRVNDVSSLDQSDNPADIAKSVANIPQIHFIGGADDVISVEEVENFLKRVGTTHCAQTKTLEHLSHDGEWAENWPRLLSLQPKCND